MCKCNSNCNDSATISVHAECSWDGTGQSGCLVIRCTAQLCTRVLTRSLLQMAFQGCTAQMLFLS